MIFPENLLQKQFIEFAGILVLGVVLGLGERRFAIRDVSKYREYHIEILAIVVLFFGALSFALLVEFFRSLEVLNPLQAFINSVPWYGLIIGTSLLGDFINYFCHRLLHSHYFWRFHRFHHSPEQLFWFTGFRASFVHMYVLGFKGILLLSISDLNPWVAGTLAVQGVFAQMVGHLNFNINIPVVSNVLVMPQYHRIHHAVDRNLHDSNYSFVWTFWDKIFKTQNLPAKTREPFEIGLPQTEKVGLIRMLLG